VGGEIFLSRGPPYLCAMGTESFPGVKRPGISANPLLTLRLRMDGTIPLPPISACAAVLGGDFYLYLPSTWCCIASNCLKHNKPFSFRRLNMQHFQCHPYFTLILYTYVLVFACDKWDPVTPRHGACSGYGWRNGLQFVG